VLLRSLFSRVAVLARVQAFLPQIEASNAALEEKDPHSLNIENTDGDDKVIQMVCRGHFIIAPSLTLNLEFGIGSFREPLGLGRLSL
jgi:hypothetical protein